MNFKGRFQHQGSKISGRENSCIVLARRCCRVLVPGQATEAYTRIPRLSCKDLPLLWYSLNDSVFTICILWVLTLFLPFFCLAKGPPGLLSARRRFSEGGQEPLSPTLSLEWRFCTRSFLVLFRLLGTYVVLSRERYQFENKIDCEIPCNPI